MPSRLSLRIALLIVIVIPLNFFVFINLNYLAVNLLRVPDSPFANFVQIALLIVSTPLLLGVLAARFVTRPLQRFMAAIAAVQHSRAHTPIPLSGVREFDHVFAAFNGLTSRLAHEEELRKSLLSDTSHELNTPLSAMLSQLTAMQDGVLPVTNERIDGLKQQTERLIDLVAQLDAYTQARLPRPLDQADEVRLLDVCRQLESVVAPLLVEQQMRLQLDVQPDYMLSADRAALEQILTNLIGNAARYSGGSTITIVADATQLSVRDDGQGVAAEHLPLLFERFYRVDASRSRASGGLGLGLSIVRALAERQGWQVHAEAADPGLRIVITFA